MYLELLEYTVHSLLIDIIEHDHNYREGHLIFQHDGAPLHYALSVRQHLDQSFSITGLRVQVLFRSSSPDLALLYFFLKTRIYLTLSVCIKDLRQPIINVCCHNMP